MSFTLKMSIFLILTPNLSFASKAQEILSKLSPETKEQLKLECKNSDKKACAFVDCFNGKSCKAADGIIENPDEASIEAQKNHNEKMFRDYATSTEKEQVQFLKSSCEQNLSKDVTDCDKANLIQAKVMERAQIESKKKALAACLNGNKTACAEHDIKKLEVQAPSVNSFEKHVTISEKEQIKFLESSCSQNMFDDKTDCEKAEKIKEQVLERANKAK
jgi:hypothetical protein